MVMLLISGAAGDARQAVQKDQKRPIVFSHESYYTPQLRTLKENYNFDELAGKGKNEFESMIMLRDWVFRKLRYSLSCKDTELRNALTILKMAGKGEAFICTGYSAVFMQCAISMGWTARYIFLKMPTGEQHAGVDVWSNQYRKWIYMDPSWNIHCEKGGIPLSIYEMRNEWIKDKGKELTYVFGAGNTSQKYPAASLPARRTDSELWTRIPITQKWLSYTGDIAIVGFNNFFSYGNGSGRDVFNRMYALLDDFSRGKRSWKFFHTNNTRDTRALFHDCNRVGITIINEQGKKGFVRMRFSAFGNYNYTPNFKTFQVQTGSSAWKDCDDDYILKLSRGKNPVKVRIVNLFGITGPVEEICINN